MSTPLPPMWISDSWGTATGTLLPEWSGWALPTTYPIITIPLSSASSHYNPASDNLALDTRDRILDFTNALISGRRWPPGKPFRYLLSFTNLSPSASSSSRLFQNPSDDLFSGTYAVASPCPHTGVVLHTAIFTRLATTLATLLAPGFAGGLPAPSGLYLPVLPDLGAYTDPAYYPLILTQTSAAGKNASNYNILPGTTISSFLASLPAASYNAALTNPSYQPDNNAYRSRAVSCILQSAYTAISTAVIAPFLASFPTASTFIVDGAYLSSPSSPLPLHPFDTASFPNTPIRYHTTSLPSLASLSEQCFSLNPFSTYGNLLSLNSLASSGYGTLSAYESRYGPRPFQTATPATLSSDRRALRASALWFREALASALVNGPASLSLTYPSSLPTNYLPSCNPILLDLCRSAAASGVTSLLFHEPLLGTSSSAASSARTALTAFLRSLTRAATTT